MDTTTGRVLRRELADATRTTLLESRTAVQAGRTVAQAAREAGLWTVTYADGSLHSIDDWADSAANGLIVALDDVVWTSHPRCRRSCLPAPEGQPLTGGDRDPGPGLDPEPATAPSATKRDRIAQRRGKPSAIRAGRGKATADPDPDPVATARAALAEALVSRTLENPSLDAVAVAAARLEEARRALGITGIIDEHLKAFSPAERRVAERLAAEGANVTALAESTVEKVRTPDAAVGAVLVEFKSASGPRGLRDRIQRAITQSPRIVILVNGDAISEEEARLIVRRELDRASRKGLDLQEVRLMADGYDVTVER